MEKFLEDCLNAHNRYRAIHGSQPLQINSKLNEYANVWATYLAKKGDITRRKTMPYGENVYIVYKKDVSRSGAVIEAADSWYEENKYYKYGESQADNLKAVRHFTQLVWKSTKFMGFGMVTSPTGQIYIVCNYYPPGNVKNEFAENVLPPKEQEQEKKKEIDEEEEEEKEEEVEEEDEEEKRVSRQEIFLPKRVFIKYVRERSFV
ncbi:Golgi-associated plant pathogenesis-related protein 1-like [Polistes fuscatus]|uniref:Golgi-associated plant pathogenesis-related protein 1-like n=1 Tax=Polistes fuscatus TaxID=30207 RepID=UPI001CA7B997|nr:Golgi-associated plant pathogenesis-related protein 1-like [Polistes fuscatus]